MKRVLMILALVMGMGLPSGAWANRGARQPVKKPTAAERGKRSKPETGRGAILHRMRSRGVIKPSKRLFANSGIAGGPSLIFSEQNVARRVTRKGAKPGETEQVNVSGIATPSSKNKSGWTVKMKIEPIETPAQTRSR